MLPLAPLALLALLAGAPLLARAAPPPVLGAQWNLTSAAGLLDFTLVDSFTNITLNGTANVSARVWNASFVAPTLFVKPGDRVILRLWNLLQVPTNVHWHGLRIPPVDGQDNAFLPVASGNLFIYNFTIPLTHPQGMFWYHSHLHPQSELQVFHGMAGILYIGDLFYNYPTLMSTSVTRNILALKDFWFDPDQLANGVYALPYHHDLDNSTSFTRLVSGLYQPQVLIDQSETQLFSVANIGPDIFYNLTLEPSGTFQIVAIDGQRQNKPIAASSYVLPAGARMEFLWTAPSTSGTVNFVTQAISTGLKGDFYSAATLAYFTVSENPALQTTSIPISFTQVTDLLNSAFAQTRTINFDNLANGNFTINNQVFQMGRVDFNVSLGTVERWNVFNNADEMHSFHIHQGAFQVAYINGVPVPFTGYQDTVLLPSKSIVQILLPFLDPLIVGTFPFHCHILSHEDLGMMGTITVYVPATLSPTVPTSSPTTTEPPSSADLSTSSIVIIATVVTVLGLVGIVGGGRFYYLWRKKAKRDEERQRIRELRAIQGGPTMRAIAGDPKPALPGSRISSKSAIIQSMGMGKGRVNNDMPV